MVMGYRLLHSHRVVEYPAAQSTLRRSLLSSDLPNQFWAFNPTEVIDTLIATNYSSLIIAYL